MTPNQIRYELLERKITMAAIGRDLGVTQPAIQRVIDRDLVSRRIMIHIAGILGMTKEQVFPEYTFDS